MDEETLRKMAVEQYLKGKTPVSIYSEIGRTRPWFFKWLRRYRSEDPEWYKDKPKAPHGHPRETSPEMKKLVTNIRVTARGSILQSLHFPKNPLNKS